VIVVDSSVWIDFFHGSAPRRWNASIASSALLRLRPLI
jgi:predicted nucleic acid-binding protein